MSLTIDRIIALYETRGVAQYGAETVSQTEHALQCAAQAEAEGASPELISACLLHDFGHLVHALGEAHLDEGVDDAHQYIVLPYLRALFPDAVLQPIRLHVDAKRYLCAVEPGYWNDLSAASKRSLELQGGVFSPDEANAFMLQPYAGDAVRLRRWDDLAKTKGRVTPELAHFSPYLRQCALIESERTEGRSQLGIVV